MKPHHVMQLKFKIITEFFKNDMFRLLINSLCTENWLWWF